MVPLSNGKILIHGGYSKTHSTSKKDADVGFTHSDMFTLVPDSEYQYFHLIFSKMIKVKIILVYTVYLIGFKQF